MGTKPEVRGRSALVVAARPLPDATAQLEAAGMAVAVADPSSGMLRTMYETRPEVIVLGGEPGDPVVLETLRGIRRLTNTPVLVIGKQAPEEAVVGVLRAGADVYMTEPLAREEFAARVEALLRRARSATPAPTHHRDDLLEIDFDAARVTVAGRELPLGPLEYRLLATLVETRDSVLSQQQLLERVWDDGSVPATRVKVTMGLLRNRFRAIGVQPPIKTVRGFGYRYTPQPIASESATAISDRLEAEFERFDALFAPLDQLRGPQGQRFFATAGARAELAEALVSADG